MNSDQPMRGDVVVFYENDSHLTTTITGVTDDGVRFQLRLKDGITMDVGRHGLSVLPERNVLLIAYLQAMYVSLGENPNDLRSGDLHWHRETVRLALADPEATAFDFHTCWYERHREDGWHFGRFFNESAKRHPAMVPFDKLTEEELAAEAAGEKALRSAIRAMGAT